MQPKESFIKRLLSVEFHLQDVLYISYLVPRHRMEPFIPSGLSLATLSDEQVFLSLVLFRSTVSHAFLCPTPPIVFDQINLRTYVIDPYTGKPGVYFLDYGVNTSFIAFLYRIVSGMAVQHIPFSIDIQRDEQSHCSRYKAEGYWEGPLYFEGEEVSVEMGSLPPFATRDDAINYLVDAAVGFYGSAGKVRRLEVWHPPSSPRVLALGTAQCRLLAVKGMVDDLEIPRPHHALVVPGWPFITYLPPRRVRMNASRR